MIATETASATAVQEDPAERVRVLSAKVRAAEATITAHRPLRNAAMLSAMREHGMSWKETMARGQVTRNSLGRLVKKATAEEGLPDGAIREVLRVSYLTRKAVVKALDREGAIVAEAEAEAEAWRKERDALVQPILHGQTRKPTGETYSDAEVAAMMGLTSPRIAQIKQGRR